MSIEDLNNSTKQAIANILLQNPNLKVKIIKEHLRDPKYKTEMCKNFVKVGFCSYKSKCRYAHGEQELISKGVSNKNYKKSNCDKFFNSTGYCPYGIRCQYLHDTRTYKNMLPSYTYQMKLENKAREIFSTLSEDTSALDSYLEAYRICVFKNQRLEAFRNICDSAESNVDTESSSYKVAVNNEERSGDDMEIQDSQDTEESKTSQNVRCIYSFDTNEEESNMLDLLFESGKKPSVSNDSLNTTISEEVQCQKP